MIRAVVENEAIKPIDPIPSHWIEGLELIVDRVEREDSSDPEDVERWCRELREAPVLKLSADEAAALDRAIMDQKEISKEFVRRQMGL